jgi:hypothetical protein
VNLDRIERLKGLLARVELNAKKPRRRPAVAAAAPVAEAVTPPKPVSAPPISLAADEFEIEDVAFDDFAVELSPTPSTAVAVRPAPVVAAQPLPIVRPAPTAPVATQPKPVIAIEDVSAEELELEEMGVSEPVEEQPIVSVSAPIQTTVQASPKPLTAPPGLEDLTFSISPPEGPAAALPPLGAPAVPTEQAPISSRQLISEAPESIDAALIAAAQAEAEEREAPLLTPPPESGKQPARPAAAEAPASRQAAPTVEQLGEVVELEELSGPSLELAEAPPVAAKPEPEELEFVPQSVAQPPAAREAMPTLAETYPEELPPSSRKIAVPTLVKEPEPSVLTPELTARKVVAVSAPVINVVTQAQGFRPKSFLELLDASLKLGKR